MIAEIGRFFATPRAWGMDERVYNVQAQTVREHGLRGLRVLASRFVGNEEEHAYPSPLRWLWIALLALTAPLGRRALPLLSFTAIPFAVHWAVGNEHHGLDPVLYAATSPLLWILGRRALQDVTVALAALVTVGAALHQNAWAFGLSLFVLLSLKEAAALYIPALLAVALLSGASATCFAIATAIAIACWIGSIRLLLGDNAWRVFHAAATGHNSKYTIDHQKGGIRRLLADFAIVSPLPLLLSAFGSHHALIVFVALVVLVHGLSAVQNIRTVLAADLALRASAAGLLIQLSPMALPVLMAIDLFGIWKLRNIYDPVTAELIKAFGPKHENQAHGA